ncbi:DUF6659 family protein [Nitrosopumilus piranensis]|uniref:Roadblock/LAMTOR2 domain-containing protein n=1 Tax=Nitrosopumilus piranensis TaxID=1582439 RepID=A0A0C5C168_9ARCH|nr:DUF6659 family protein [Nitrosopumilus piranensis]AJM93070.1 hypothetical protein NPIRD3C_1860 [Nitrosopumilus piranensis]
MNPKKLCSLILGLEPQIRSVYVYHNNGELLAGGMHDGISSLLPPDELTKSIHNTLLRWKTRELMYPFLGTGKYSLTEYEEVKRITFPLKNYAVLVIGMETTAEHNVIIEKIRQLIE